MPVRERHRDVVEGHQTREAHERRQVQRGTIRYHPEVDEDVEGEAGDEVEEEARAEVVLRSTQRMRHKHTLAVEVSHVEAGVDEEEAEQVEEASEPPHGEARVEEGELDGRDERVDDGESEPQSAATRCGGGSRAGRWSACTGSCLRSTAVRTLGTAAGSPGCDFRQADGVGSAACLPA